MYSRYCKQAQRGYSLFELSMVLVIMALAIMVVITMQVEQARDDRARAVAQIYQRLNNAVGTYMTNNYEQLLKLHPGCGIMPIRSEGSDGLFHPFVGYVDIARCTMKVGTQTIANGLQPTLDDLQKFGVLGDVSAGVALPLPVDTAFPLVDSTVPGSPKKPPTQWRVLIQKICIGGAAGGVNNGQPFFSETNIGAVGCVGGTTDFRSLIFNLYPYDVNGFGGSAYLSQVRGYIGSDGYLTDIDPVTGDAGELKSKFGGFDSTIISPMRTYVKNGDPASGTPLPYILAMRNGYGSSGWDKYVRRDGSTPLTGTLQGDLSLNGQLNVNQVATVSGALTAKGNVEVNGDLTTKQNATVSGAFTTNGDATVKGKLIAQSDATVSGALSVSKDVNAAGSVTGATGIFGAITRTVTAALRAASAFVEGALTVAGNTTLEKDLSVGGAAKVTGNISTDGYVFAAKGVRMTNYKNLGDTCDPNSETLALQSATVGGTTASDAYSKGLRLLVCSAGSTKWERPQEYAAASTPVTPTKTPNPNNIQNEWVEIKYTLDRNIPVGVGGGLDFEFTQVTVPDQWDVVVTKFEDSSGPVAGFGQTWWNGCTWGVLFRGCDSELYHLSISGTYKVWVKSV